MDGDDRSYAALNNPADYSDYRHLTPLPTPPDHLISPENYQALASPPFYDPMPMIRSDLAFSTFTSSVSGASTEIPRSGSGEEISSSVRAKIAAHPLYPKLLEAFIDCQKVGAPPEIEDLLDEICRENNPCRRSTAVSPCLGGADRELDEFMETYCGILVRFKSDLEKPFNEATAFLNRMETQLGNLCSGASRSYVSDETTGSSEDDFSLEETQVQESNDISEDRELKDKLLSKYGGYISTLKHEFSKKKKGGKLPKEARKVLLDWWTIHYKWPYPTEADKIALAQATGLDQKQINNWFINQRKRHWRPSENMQFAVMGNLYGPFFIDD